MQLRPYQVEAKAAAIKAWSTGAKGVCIVMPTGAGKTATLASIVKDHGGYSVVAAHRQEIISQLSLSLAREGIRHRIVGSTSLIKLCVQIHLSEIGKDFYDPNATCAVASVQTLTARTAKLSEWAKTITLVVGDEHHHYVRDNQFGKAIQLFPNAKLLGVTATPIRADGKGLGSHADGFVDALVEGPTMQWLIANGFLSSYRIFAPPSDLDLSEVNISKATGDYVKDKLVKAVHKSHIVGDVVEHYKKLAFGKRGLTFCTDVKTATDLAEEFNKAGVPAIALSGKTPDRERIEALKKFKRGEYLQITSVSLFDEGTDIPAVECVSFAAPTASFGRYIQSFGRGLRPVYAEGLPLNTAAERLYAMSVSTKPNAIIIDHVGNVVRHGLPDANREWSLDQREKRASNKPDDVIPVRACPECTMVYEKTHIACPYCGFKPVPAERSSPEQVDGDRSLRSIWTRSSTGLN